MRHRFRRRLNYNFRDIFFKPSGIPMKDLKEVVITHDQLETLRLRYLKNLNQIEAAKKMGISQSQYQRDLWNANKKITEALINGDAIRLFADKLT